MYKKAVDNIEEFRKIIRELPGSVAYYSDEVNHCDMAMGDVRHFVEEITKTRKLTVKERNEVARLLKEYSDRRRVAKDNIIVLKGLATWVENNKSVWSNLDSVFGELRKQYKYVTSARTYKPRVLKALFEQEEVPTAVSIAVAEAEAVVAPVVEVAQPPKLLSNSQIRKALRKK